MPRRRGSSSSSSAAGGSGGHGGGFGLSSLRRELHLHNFFRTSSPSASSTSRTPPAALPPRTSAVTIPGSNHKLTSSASSYHPPRELTASTFSAGSATAADGLGGAHLTPSLSSSVHARRESFLYRGSDDLREASSLRPHALTVSEFTRISVFGPKHSKLIDKTHIFFFFLHSTSCHFKITENNM
ncbi:hypothetical protein CAEBREN_09549 [Caenorhabditis brenneri]|uniref:Uncharacterized protein n=1 Tax=Caenorhabditis brenneri TaxID=135651 RepID=G0N9K2_CAEBE|nr:hypothetical protein CAEBREN_09549 [Caenorhabditis brenneri]